MKHILLFCCMACISTIRLNAQTGIPVPEMAQCDALVKEFLANYDIPGATFALSKNGKIVYMRAFGFSDINKTTPTRPHHLFRIASLSKPVTAVAIMKLVENGQLALSAKVFGTGGILQNHPVFSNTTITDSRIYDITVQNLLEHSAGWNRSINCNPDPTTPYPWFVSGCDPIGFPLHVTEQTGTPNPVTQEALIKFLLQKGLDFAPNTGYAYSNIGYLVLGEIIEQITGKSYVDYVKNSILAPLGIYDMHIANNLLSEKQEREGEYVGYGPGYETLSMYGDGSYVPYEYGGFNINAMDAHGGWIATARDLVRLLVAVDGFSTKPDILQSATITTMTTPSANASFYAKGWTVNSANNWWHTGALPGTASILVRTSGGYTWTVILNKRNIEDPSFFSALDALPWNCIASTSSWPTFDLMESPTVNASGMAFTNVTLNSITVNWLNGNGDKRLLIVRLDSAINQYPLDGIDYVANQDISLSASLGANNYIVYNGNGTSATITGLTPGKTYYFRLIEYNKNAVTGNNALYQLGNNAQSSKATQADDDGDGISNTADNCPLLSNPNQLNTDGDAQGDACDVDDDNDGVLDMADNCPTAANRDQLDTDGDGQGNACDSDDDGDGDVDATDCAPLDATIHHGAVELCGNGIDDNCNGQTDEGCTSITVTIVPSFTVEGDRDKRSMLFIVGLNKPAPGSVSVKYKTSDGTAKAGSDYQKAEGTVSFSKGQWLQFITVNVYGDKQVESNEQFSVQLSSPVNVKLYNTGKATGTIVNDDRGHRSTITSANDLKVKETPEVATLVVPNVLHRSQVWRIPNLPATNEVAVFDRIGKLLWRSVNYHNDKAFSNIATGLYFYNIIVRDNQGKPQVYKGKLLIAE